MKKTHHALTVALILVALALSRKDASAQQPPNFGNMGNMDPQQIQAMIQQRVMDNLREQLVITNDAEWGVVEGRLSKVVAGRMDTMMSGGMGMMGRMGPGGPGGRGGGNGAGRGFAGFGQPSPEATALQSALDSNAPASQIKAALDKFRDARKRKQAELAKAQDELRQVLSMRQEAALVSMGMLD
jgi:hypothetical protein